MKILPQRQEVSLIALIAASSQPFTGNRLAMKIAATASRNQPYRLDRSLRRNPYREATDKDIDEGGDEDLPQRQEISLIALIAAFVATLIGNRLGKR
jgi:hypothetical protein